MTESFLAKSSKLEVQSFQLSALGFTLIKPEVLR